MTFKYIELFAGIGGFRSALDPLGGECVFASEIDTFATKSYHSLYGEICKLTGTTEAPELHGDITKIDAHDIPDHDVLVGGFPCQAFSVAGQRKGFEDARGTLFFEIARIASAKQPRLMLLENVKGLLSHDGGHTIEVMASVLNDIGYAIDFRVLNSKHFGVPQNRERIFIVCDRDVDHVDWNVSGNDVVAKAKRRIQALGVRTFNFEWPTNDAVTTRLRDVLETNVGERYYLSEEKTAKLIAQLNERGQTADSDDCEMVGLVDGINGHDICRRVYTPTGVAPTIPTGSSGNTTPKVVIEEPRCIQQNQQRKVFVKNEVGTLHASMTNNQAPKILEPQIEKVGHLPSDSGQTGAIYGADGLAPTCLNQHGNAVTKIAEPCVNDRGTLRTNGEGISNVIDANYAKGLDNHGQRTHVLEPYTVIQKTHSACTTVKYDETGTLQAARLDKVPQVVVKRPEWIPGPDDVNRTVRTSGKSSLDYKHNCDYVAENSAFVGSKSNYRIRKLTPLECWRLQGFTDEQHANVAAAGISDSQRYKQAGNAVTVNVISAIGRRLIPLLNTNKPQEVAV